MGALDQIVRQRQGALRGRQQLPRRADRRRGAGICEHDWAPADHPPAELQHARALDGGRPAARHRAAAAWA